MTWFIFFAVLFAALLPASWNALVKSTGDKVVSMTAITIGHAPLPILALPFIPAPAPESWPWLVASVVFHAGYQLFLMLSYRLGDYTQVYPIARGSGPAIVAIISVFVLGIAFETWQLAAIALICLGIFALGLLRQGNGLRNPQAVGAALVTGCFIASYSLIDGLGAREAGTAFGYIAWMTILNAIVFSIIIFFFNRRALGAVFTEGKTVLFLGGGASVIAYVIVVWAMTQAPIALVTALRETSTIFALGIGVIFLKETLTVVKIMATSLTASGVMLLKFGRMLLG